MIFSTLLLSVLLAVSTLVQASPVEPRKDEAFISGFLDTLNKAGLTTLSHQYEDFFGTDERDKIVDLLKSGYLTLLAPENSAFSPDKPSIGTDPLTVFQYNTIIGNIDDHFKFTSNSTSHKRSESGRSNAGTGASLPQRGGSRKRSFGLLGERQIQVIDKFSTGNQKRWNNEPVILIDRAVGSAKVVGRTVFKKIVILIIDAVLTLPTKISDLLCKQLVSNAPKGFVRFGGGLQKTGLLDLVDNAPRATVFAPIDDAFEGLDLSDDELSDILKNHITYNDVPVYSTLFPFIGKAEAKSGKELEFIVDENARQVKCGKSTANVLRSDVTSYNGVLHVIDKVLKCD
ncbi:hypothetical protein FRC07_006012 [Ceratobasidium sp. 392]|nr:hypothetical protein FRC07_006012 [Ceratobasidium sp. 392]